MTKRFIIEIDLTHESFNVSLSNRIAARLRNVALRLEADSYDALSDGVVHADGYIPSECGRFMIVT